MSKRPISVLNIFPRRFLWLILVAFSLLMALGALRIMPGFFQPMAHILDDWRTRYSWHSPLAPEKKHQLEQRVVIVDIDERSLVEQGAWPWSRQKVSQLISTMIDHYGVSGVALDIVFPEVKEDDIVLANQLAREQVTGAVVYDLLGRNQAEVTSGLPALPAIRWVAQSPVIVGLPVTTNHPKLMPVRAGHITPLFDTDGSIRHLPPLACHRLKRAECRPLLGIAAFMGLIASSSLEVRPGQGLLSPAWQLSINDSENATVVQVPIDEDGALTVPYRHRPEDWLAISATDILKKRAQPDLLRGALVLVGATALGMSDVVYTPVSPVASGMEPHAEVMVALLDNSFLVVPQYGNYLAGALLLPLIALLAIVVSRFQTPLQRSMVYPVWLLFCWLYATLVSLLAYSKFDLLLPLTPFALFPVFASVLLGSAELFFATREKNGISGLLAAYLPKQVARKLAAANHIGAGMDTSVDASRRMITVLFADVRGFTGIAEGHKPEIVAKLMHRIFSEMAAAVVGHQGTIDKFIGDAVMAFWNAPEDDEHHALHALAAAQDMLRRMHSLEAYCLELGVPHVNIGIGIESGFALVGNFGSEHRRTFTALGETVVLASRIEGMTSQFQRSILIGEACAKKLNYVGLDPLGNAQIRGRQRELALYTPRSVPVSLGERS